MKAFIAAEIYPILQARHISNPAKYLSDELFLKWRPKDLVRLMCFRIARNLEDQGDSSLKDVDWTNYDEIISKVWTPFVGTTATNKKGRGEGTIAYLLRHTQLRPRQGHDPLQRAGEGLRCCVRTTQDSPTRDISNVVHDAEMSLTVDVLNSYEHIYPLVTNIVDATLSETNMLLEGSLLDSVAKRAQAYWPAVGHEEYSLASYRALVARLGIVGRVKRKDKGQSFRAGGLRVRPERLARADAARRVRHPPHVLFTSPNEHHARLDRHAISGSSGL